MCYIMIELMFIKELILMMSIVLLFFETFEVLIIRIRICKNEAVNLL